MFGWQMLGIVFDISSTSNWQLHCQFLTYLHQTCATCLTWFDMRIGCKMFDMCWHILDMLSTDAIYICTYLFIRFCQVCARCLSDGWQLVERSLEFAGPLAQGVSDNGHLFPLPSSHLLPCFPSSSLLPIDSTLYFPSSGSWRLEVGSWKLEVGSWKLEVSVFCSWTGAWGPSPGSHPGPNYKDHFLAWTPWNRIEIDVDADVVFYRFVLDLGCLLGSFLIPSGTLFGPSWCQHRLRTIF